MEEAAIRFTSLDHAIAALKEDPRPMILLRLAPNSAERVVIARNDAAAALPNVPDVGEQPDRRRDRRYTADFELSYLYEQLISRGHAGQVIALNDERYVELTVTRVVIDEDDTLYGFITPKAVEK
jgi:hypothetical protein